MLISTQVEIVVEVGVELGKNTEKELLEFLRSDESLFVYSNHQELQATANLYDMNINVFTYGGDFERWTKITPDPKMVAEADAKIGKLIPDMALYHNLDSHYDLLVKDDSRLAFLGLLAGASSHNFENKEASNMEKVDQTDQANTEWETVTRKRKGMGIPKQAEKLLEEEQENTAKEISLEEEIDVMVAKQLCNKKTNQQESIDVENKQTSMYDCDRCDSQPHESQKRCPPIKKKVSKLSS